MKKNHLLIAFFLMFLNPLVLIAADEETDDEQTAEATVQYLEVKPGIIANYGAGSDKPRLLNADVTLQISDEETADKIAMYLVPIRHDLIMMFSNLKHDEADTGEKVENLRAKALESVHGSLSEWSDSLQVVDVLFTSFVTE
ncbi:MAG: flagellar basal body-associated FliL family protein [Pseudomonadota bacterium]